MVYRGGFESQRLFTPPAREAVTFSQTLAGFDPPASRLPVVFRFLGAHRPRALMSRLPSLIADRTSFIEPVKVERPVDWPARVSIMSHIPLCSEFFRTIWPLMILSFFILSFFEAAYWAALFICQHHTLS